MSKNFRTVTFGIVFLLISTACLAVTGSSDSKSESSFKPYSGKIPKPGGIIAKVTLAKGVEGENFDPVDLSTKFGPKATIHAVASVKDAPDGTKFIAKWLTTDVGNAEIPNALIDEVKLTAPDGGGSGNLDFSLSPKNPLPEGNYRVEISVNGKLDQIKEFSIIAGDSEADASSPTPPPSFKPYSSKIPKPGGIITKVTMALGFEDKTFNPIDPTTEFAADVPLFAVVAIKKAPEGTIFSIKWLATDVGDIAEPNTLIFEDKITTSGTRNLGFSLSHTKTLPEGNFRVEISVNGKLDQIKEFSVVAGDSVESSEPDPAALDYIQSVTMAKGVDGENPVNPTSVFGQNDSLHAITKIAGAADGTIFTAQWMVNDNGDVNKPDTVLKSTTFTFSPGGDGTLDFSLIPDSKMPKGTYRVEILVDDQSAWEESFEVK